jgi:hypothetical protein
LVSAGFAATLALAAQAAWADSRTSADYELRHESTGGGGRGSSADYTNDASLEGQGGATPSADYTVRSGFPGQINLPPDPSANVLTRVGERSAKLATKSLIADDSDPEGDALTLVSVATLSSLSHTVAVQDGFAIYQATSGFSGSDTFTYVVADAWGDASVGSVLVTPQGVSAAPSLNLVSQNLASGTLTLQFAGLPGLTYRIQGTDSLSPANWADLGDVATSSIGLVVFEDTSAAEHPTRYYRAVIP